MNDAEKLLDAAKAVEFKDLKELLLDIPAAVAALPKEEQERYEAAKQSVVRARRSAEASADRIWLGALATG